MTDKIEELYNAATAVTYEKTLVLRRYFDLKKQLDEELKKPAFDPAFEAAQAMGEVALKTYHRDPVSTGSMRAAITGLDAKLNELDDKFDEARGNFRAEVINEVRTVLAESVDAYLTTSKELVEFWEEIAGLNQWLVSVGADPRLASGFLKDTKIPSPIPGSMDMVDGTRTRLYRSKTEDILSKDGQALFDGAVEVAAPPPPVEPVPNAPGEFNAALGSQL